MARYVITFEATKEIEVEVDESKAFDPFNEAVRKARRELDPDVDWDVQTGRKL